MTNKSGQSSCPKCASTLQPVAFGESITLRRCEGCSGLLIHREMLKALKKAWMAEEIIDIGDYRVGRKNDAMIDIHCPDCQNSMETLLDEDQTHVCMEYCEPCELVYLDAGELTDLKHLTLMDYIWDFFSRKR